MEEIDELFNHAYQLHVLEEKHDMAIKLCRKILEIDPDNYRTLVFLGMLLGDNGDDQERLEARSRFVQAIRIATTTNQVFTDWPEEAAVYHLGLWELSQGRDNNAFIFFLIDSIVTRSPLSLKCVTDLIQKLYPDVRDDIQLILDRARDYVYTKKSNSKPLDS